MPALFISKSSHLYCLKGSKFAAKTIDALSSLPAPKALMIIASSASISSMSLITEGLKNDNSAVRQSTRNLMNLDYSIPDSFEFSKIVMDTFMAHGLPINSKQDALFDELVIEVLALLLQNKTIPIVQLSVIKNVTPAYYYLLGQALANLKSKGVLIVGSGSLSCHLPLTKEDNQVPDWVIEFEIWMQEQILSNNIYKLINYQEEAPFARFNQLTEDDLMPLFVIMGAMGNVAKSKLVFLKNKSKNQPLDGFIFS